MLLRPPHLRLAPRTFAILVLCLLTATFVYFHEHGRGRHAVQPALVLRYLSDPSLASVERGCREHGFTPYVPKSNSSRLRRVYDLFPFHQELDWLEIRLKTLAPVVDYFVITEYTTTFTGLPNRPVLRDNWKRFKEFEDQILHFVIDDTVNSTWVWDHESYMKNALLYKTFPMLDSKQQAVEDDVIVVSDVDEIPKPETLTLLRHCQFPERLTLRSYFYYYSFQWLHRGEQWQHPQATIYHGVNGTISPDDLRYNKGGVNTETGLSSYLTQPYYRWRQQANLWGAAWHCSSCFFSIEQVLAKMAAYSHIEYNTPQNRDPRLIADRVRHGLDLFGRWGQNYDKIERNMDVPPFVLQNEERFKYLLDRDGEDAAFVDFEEQVAALAKR